MGLPDSSTRLPRGSQYVIGSRRPKGSVSTGMFLDKKFAGSKWLWGSEALKDEAWKGIQKGVDTNFKSRKRGLGPRARSQLDMGKDDNTHYANWAA